MNESVEAVRINPLGTEALTVGVISKAGVFNLGYLKTS
jgi:hypothetical protein